MRAAFLRLVALAAAGVLGGCAGYDPPGTTYIRTDGQAVTADQVSADRKACESADKPQRCMLEKGYFLVKSDEVGDKQQQLADVAARNQQERDAAIAAEKKRQADLRRAELRKKKKKKQPASATTKPQAGAAGSAQPANNMPPASSPQFTTGTSQSASAPSQSVWTQGSGSSPWPQR